MAMRHTPEVDAMTARRVTRIEGAPEEAWLVTGDPLPPPKAVDRVALVTPIEARARALRIAAEALWQRPDWEDFPHFDEMSWHAIDDALKAVIRQLEDLADAMTARRVTRIEGAPEEAWLVTGDPLPPPKAVDRVALVTPIEARACALRIAAEALWQRPDWEDFPHFDEMSWHAIDDALKAVIRQLEDLADAIDDPRPWPQTSGAILRAARP